MTDTKVTKVEEDSVQTVRGPENDTTYLPDVDIREDDGSIRVFADMPGVDQNTVSVTVEKNVLTVEGEARVDTPEGYRLVGQEYGVGRYRRDFTLSDAVDPDGIKARVRHGVLELTLPKREHVKTRKVEIEA